MWLVRGGFRNSGCVPIDVHEATLSIVTNLVRPLRSNGAHVHVFALLSKCKTCNAYEELELNHTLRRLVSELSRQRATASGDQEPRPFSIAWQRMATLSQGHGMRAGLDAFNERRRSRDVPSEYDLVLITRIDLHIMAPLNAWWPHHAWNSSSYAFLSQCKAGNVDWERPGACLCTSDWLHAFSWRAFLAFDAVAGDTSRSSASRTRGAAAMPARVATTTPCAPAMATVAAHRSGLHSATCQSFSPSGAPSMASATSAIVITRSRTSSVGRAIGAADGAPQPPLASRDVVSTWLVVTINIVPYIVVRSDLQSQVTSTEVA